MADALASPLTADEEPSRSAAKPTPLPRQSKSLLVDLSPSTSSPLHDQPGLNLSSLARLAIRPPEIPRFVPEGPVPWHRFWSRFENVIGSQPHFTDVEKLEFLYSHLEGAAKLVIAGFLDTDNGYALAIDRLKKRFDRSDKRLDELMEKILTYPPLDDAYVPRLRAQTDGLLNLITELENIGRCSDECNDIMRVRLEKLMPVAWKERWYRKKPKRPTAKQVAQFI
jgi:hypothetical protein